MKIANVSRFVDNVFEDLEVVEEILTMIHPSLIRKESDVEVRRGLRQVFQFTLHEVSRSRGSHRGSDGTEHHVLELFSVDGSRIVLATRTHRVSPFSDRDVLRCITTEDHCHACATTVPVWQAIPNFDPRADIIVSRASVSHVTDEVHAVRFDGFSAGQIRSRLSPALLEAHRSIVAGEISAAPYWHAQRRSASHVLPIALTKGGPAVAAAVLNREEHAYSFVTALPLHSAFWNVATLGCPPPTWLDRQPGHGLAA